MKTPGILNVWNPLIEPRTVELHVDHLRGRPDGWTWWGRIDGRPGAGPASAPGKKITRMIECSAEACAGELASRGHVTVLVTDYVSLHALKVTEVRHWDARPPEQELAEYYNGRNAFVWYRVTDVRALSYDQTSTLSYLRQHVRYDMGLLNGHGKYVVPLDPYASVGYLHPLPIELETDLGIFDERPRSSRFVDDAEAAHSLPVQRALTRLARDLPRLWRRTSRPAQLFLAAGEAMHAYLGRDASAFAVRPAAQGLVQAVERELLDGFFTPLKYPRSGHARAAELLDGIQKQGCVVSEQMTMGGLRLLVAGLATEIDAFAGAGRCAALRGFAEEQDSKRGHRTSFGQLLNLRNDVSHSREVDPKRFKKVWELTLKSPDAPLLERILDARDELAEVLG